MNLQKDHSRYIYTVRIDLCWNQLCVSPKSIDFILKTKTKFRWWITWISHRGKPLRFAKISPKRKFGGVLCVEFIRIHCHFWEWIIIFRVKFDMHNIVKICAQQASLDSDAWKRTHTTITCNKVCFLSMTWKLCDYPLNLSILFSGGKETNQDPVNSGERKQESTIWKKTQVFSCGFCVHVGRSRFLNGLERPSKSQEWSVGNWRASW